MSEIDALGDDAPAIRDCNRVLNEASLIRPPPRMCTRAIYITFKIMLVMADITAMIATTQTLGDRLPVEIVYLVRRHAVGRVIWSIPNLLYADVPHLEEVYTLLMEQARVKYAAAGEKMSLWADKVLETGRNDDHDGGWFPDLARWKGSPVYVKMLRGSPVVVKLVRELKEEHDRLLEQSSTKAVQGG